MKNLVISIVILMVSSCSPVGKCNMSSDKLNKRIERKIESGMRYNKKCVERERELKLNTLR